jgi:hypothetical protein
MRAFKLVARGSDHSYTSPSFFIITEIKTAAALDACDQSDQMFADILEVCTSVIISILFNMSCTYGAVVL